MAANVESGVSYTDSLEPEKCKETSLVSVKLLADLRARCSSDEDCAKVPVFEYPIYSRSNLDSLRMKIHRCIDKIKVMKKKKDRNLEQYMTTDLDVPLTHTEQISSKFESDRQKKILEKVIAQTKHFSTENRALKREYGQLIEENASLQDTVSCLSVTKISVSTFSSFPELPEYFE